MDIPENINHELNNREVCFIMTRRGDTNHAS